MVDDVRTTVTAVALVAALLMSCTGASSPPDAPATTGTAPASPSPPPDLSRVRYYEPLIRELASFAGSHADRLAIREEICRTAAEPFARQEVCRGAFTDEERVALVDRLTDVADRVIFYTGDDAPGRGLRVWVGTPDPHGDKLWIGGGMSCGGFCAQGGTYVLRPRGERWEVHGNAPGTGSWIA